MTIATLVSLAAFATQNPAPVEFHRQFVKGERAQYEVQSTLNAEVRMADLDSWIPEDLDLIYRFNYAVTEMKADGICVMRYQRPTMTEIQGETADSPPRTKVEKTNLDFELTVSPINEVLGLKDLTKKPEKKPGSSGSKLNVFSPAGRAQLQAFVGQFTGEIYRIALFVGSLDSSMDFAPPLPVTEVAVGDTWKKTVGFSPQKLGSKGDKLAVQRMDFTYTYKGIVESNGKKVHRIEGALNLKTDIAAFIHQTFNVKSDVTGLKEIPMNMTSTVQYDLDLKTHQTLSASAVSSGGFGIVATVQPKKPVQEERFKARSNLILKSLKR